MIPRYRLLWLVLSLAILCAACGPGNTVRLIPPPALSGQSLPAPNAPSICVVNFEDERSDEFSVGVRRDGSAFTTNQNVSEWISRALADELARDYSELSPKERETVMAKKYGAIFIIGIGGDLCDGKPHDGRAPDYDDWSTINEAGYAGLNGDIIVWNHVLDIPVELSSMGIRVSPESLTRQLEMRGCPEKAQLTFHRMLLEGELPYTIGGGIGQSRLCMLLLHKAHVGEVQASIWPEEHIMECAAAGIELL